MKAVAGYLPVDLEPHARAAVAGPLDAQRQTQATAPRPQPYLHPSTVNVADTSVSMGAVARHFEEDTPSVRPCYVTSSGIATITEHARCSNSE
jgi:hypothetical protein